MASPLDLPPAAGYPVGRFAPSPSGPLHFGSLLAALASYCLARQGGGRWLLRIEDLDPPRVVPGAADAILRTLERLGFTWDGPVLYQSQRSTVYEAALTELRRQGRLFPCGCSRREVLASAPHLGEEGPIYSGRCRAGLPPGAEERALRLRVPDEALGFVDGVYGPVQQNLAHEVGDFVLKRADGLFAYQLAVVVDDALSGVNQVVRGADLLASTPRQLYLYRCFDWPVPGYLHLPLALGADGEKLSKRHTVADPAPNPSAWLTAALSFLGQAVPEEIHGAPPQELLAWGMAQFDVRRIEPRNRPVGPAAYLTGEN